VAGDKQSVVSYRTARLYAVQPAVRTDQGVIVGRVVGFIVHVIALCTGAKGCLFDARTATQTPTPAALAAGEQFAAELHRADKIIARYLADKFVFAGCRGNTEAEPVILAPAVAAAYQGVVHRLGQCFLDTAHAHFTGFDKPL